MRIYVTSLDRPGNVPAMEAMAGPAELIWCVPITQSEAYLRAGARRVLPGPPGKPDKINAVLDAYGDEWCVFSDDDCRKLTMLTSDNRREQITLGAAALAYVAVGETRHDHLVAIPNISNVMFASRRVTNWGSTVGWFMAVGPNTECRLNPKLLMEHDVDFACQVYERYGRIARVGWIIGDYRYADKQSHFREQHANRVKAHQALIARYPGLLYWKNEQVLGFRKVP